MTDIFSAFMIIFLLHLNFNLRTSSKIIINNIIYKHFCEIVMRITKNYKPRTLIFLCKIQIIIIKNLLKSKKVIA